MLIFKMRRLFFFLFCLFLITLSMRASAQDLQYWTELKYAHPFKNSLFELNWATENRFNDDSPHYFLFNTTLGFTYKYKPWWNFGFGFRYETAKKNIIDDFNDEYRLMPQWEWTLKIASSDIKWRNLFELRILPEDGISGDFRFRYRGRFRWQRKFPIGTYSFTPYVSNEVFVEPERGNFNQDRLIIGNSIGFLKDKFSVDFYYLFLSTMNSSSKAWTRVSVLGTSIGVRY